MAKYLSRTDLSHIAGRYIEQYYNFFGISKDAPEPIDPERLASSVLGLNVKMLPLCSDGSVLGLTVFQKCGFTVTLGDGTKLVEVFMPKDVVIDSALAADSCTGCRNFTIAHEGEHPCSGAADANISGQRRNKTCSAVPAKRNPVQIRIGPEL